MKSLIYKLKINRKEGKFNSRVAELKKGPDLKFNNSLL